MGIAADATTLGAAAPPATACVLKSMTVTLRVTSLATNAKRLCLSLFGVAMPIGFCPLLSGAMPAGFRLMNMLLGAPTSAMLARLREVVLHAEDGVGGVRGDVGDAAALHEADVRRERAA